jgi:hypothetical protein
MKQIPDFKTALERQQWFIANADYFTAITRLNRQNIRAEFPNLGAAEAYAHEELKNVNYRSFLIYAVVGNSDTFVKSVLRNNDNHSEPGNNPN